jgi:hypothetical protein
MQQSVRDNKPQALRDIKTIDLQKFLIQYGPDKRTNEQKEILLKKKASLKQQIPLDYKEEMAIKLKTVSYIE